MVNSDGRFMMFEIDLQCRAVLKRFLNKRFAVIKIQ
jgi:hypothetical protein